MKKYCYFIKKATYAILFLCVINLYMLFGNFVCINNFSVGYETQQIVYAKILDNCKLYKTSAMSEDISECYFYLPATYFVSIISCINDDIYQVQYSSFVGYVFSSHINKVSFTPIEPELKNITFGISQNAGTQIWTCPSDSKGNKLTTIPAGTSNIEYISSTAGDIPIGGTVNLWYYARYTPTSNSTKVYEGYIYSEATCNLTNIPNNLEVEIEENSPNLDNSISIDKPLKIVLIILICTPFVILIVASIIKAIPHIKQRKNTIKKSESRQVQPTNTSFVRKHKAKPHADEKFDPIETIEVNFPQYDYIDDDDLL